MALAMLQSPGHSVTELERCREPPSGVPNRVARASGSGIGGVPSVSILMETLSRLMDRRTLVILTDWHIGDILGGGEADRHPPHEGERMREGVEAPARSIGEPGDAGAITTEPGEAGTITTASGGW